jgi:Ni/Co efflux regulator RcnB
VNKAVSRVLPVLLALSFFLTPVAHASQQRAAQKNAKRLSKQEKKQRKKDEKMQKKAMKEWKKHNHHSGF